MLLKLYQFIVAKCKLLAQQLSIFWSTTFRPDAVRFPLSPDQIDDKCQEFIDSLDKDAVCALASFYNDGKPCRIATCPVSGSFNVCFLVEFYTENQTWIVRVPIEPAIHDTWGKVQSEVATMQYIQCHTNIPVPRIHAYGRNAKLTKTSSTTQAFLVLGYIPGRSLRIQDLVDSPEVHRKRFYAELIEILGELRRLEFPLAGSLMPDPRGGPEPIISNMLTMASNELEIGSRKRVTSSTFTSTTHLIHYQYGILKETYRLPAVSLSRETAELETFALENLGQRINQFLGDACDNGPCFLSHTDLRCSNIIVDDELHIRGIIDWDWANVAPRKLSPLPPWITGHDLDAIAFVPHRMIMMEFSDVLRTKQDSTYCREALEDLDIQENLLPALVQILRHPSSLIRIYYKFIFPQLFGEPRGVVLSSYFQRNKTKALEIQRRLHESTQYTRHLRENGLLRPHDETPPIIKSIQAWVTKAEITS